jgi:hypothetical protein
MPIEDQHKKDLAHHVTALNRALVAALKDWGKLHPEDKTRESYRDGVEKAMKFDGFVGKANE